MIESRLDMRQIDASIPDVAFVTPTKDRPITLHREIQSVLNRSFQNWVHVISTHFDALSLCSNGYMPQSGCTRCNRTSIRSAGRSRSATWPKFLSPRRRSKLLLFRSVRERIGEKGFWPNWSRRKGRWSINSRDRYATDLSLLQNTKQRLIVGCAERYS